MTKWESNCSAEQIARLPKGLHPVSQFIAAKWTMASTEHNRSRTGVFLRPTGDDLLRLRYAIRHPETLSDNRRFPTG